MTRRYGSGAAVFLMEQLVAILIFAVCAAVCVTIFVKAYTMADDANALNNAMLAVSNSAEVFKSTKGDTGQTARILGGAFDGLTVSVYYDSNWNVCGQDAAVYVMEITNRKDGHLICGDISVNKSDGSEIVRLTAAVREEAAR